MPPRTVAQYITAHRFRTRMVKSAIRRTVGSENPRRDETRRNSGEPARTPPETRTPFPTFGGREGREGFPSGTAPKAISEDFSLKLIFLFFVVPGDGLHDPFLFLRK
jgi:hypothetical protein